MIVGRVLKCDCKMLWIFFKSIKFVLFQYFYMCSLQNFFVFELGFCIFQEEENDIRLDFDESLVQFEGDFEDCQVLGMV